MFSKYCIVQDAASKFALTSPQPTAGFMTAAELGHLRERCIRISTGSKQLDAALNGYSDMHDPTTRH